MIKIFKNYLIKIPKKNWLVTFKNLSLYQKITLSIFLVTTLFIFFSFFNILNLKTQELSITKEKNSLSIKIHAQQENLDNFKKYQKEYNKVITLYAKYQKSTSNLLEGDFITYILKHSHEDAVTTVSIQQNQPNNLDTTSNQTWQLEIFGEYKNLILFIFHLLKSQTTKPIKINSLEISPLTKNTEETQNQILLLRCLLELTDLEKLSPENPGFNKPLSFKPTKITIQDFYKNPFALEKNILNHQPLGINFWPIDNLKIIGVLENNNEKIAIISDPNQDIYQVTTQEKIGQEQKTIQQINTNSILLNDGTVLSIN